MSKRTTKDWEIPNMSKPGQWTAIVLTCSNSSLTKTLQEELLIRQAEGFIDPNAIILTVEDPRTNVGSGGATVNALVTIVEYLSARKGYTVINPDVLKNTSILILHVGRLYCYEPCTRPFIALPVENASGEFDGLLYNIDFLIRVIAEKFAVKSGPGIWTASTDGITSIPDDAEIPWKECDIAGLCIPSTLKFGKQHGVFKLDENGIVEDILYQRGADELGVCQRRDGSIPLVTGIIFFNRKVTEKLLLFYIKPPLDGCCYMGLDSGQPPIKLSLFFDLMLPMTTGVSETDFVSGSRSHSFGQSPEGEDESSVSMRQARRILWKELHGFKIQSCMIETGSFIYLYDLATDYKRFIQESPYKDYKFTNLTWNNVIHSHIAPSCVLEEEVVVINSSIKGNVKVGKKSIITHSTINGIVNLGKDSIMNAVTIDKIKNMASIDIDDDIVIQGFNIYLKTLPINQHVLTVHGRFDNIKAPTWKSNSTFCNAPWVLFLNRTGIIHEDLWSGNVKNEDESIFTARLFPVFHASHNVGIKEILWMQGMLEDDENKSILHRWRSSWRLSYEELMSFIDFEKEFQHRRNLFFGVSCDQIEQALVMKENKGFHSVYNSASKEGYTDCILEILDQVAVSTAHPDIAARTLANIADVLGCMAGQQGGLRSGPAGNISWKKAYNLLENDKYAEGITAMAKERRKWLHRPDLLVRAARHYEGAAQILIRKAVMSAKEYIKLEKTEQPNIGDWVKAECPARIDLAGGWSDTPPITYEHGGAVTIASLLINGKKPIGARVRRIEEPVIKLEIISSQGDKNIVICSQLSDLEDYCQPHAQGALLKSAFICADMIQLDSEVTLKDQLMTKYGSGFELQSWSNLPQGSGLGTSSILAGVVIASLLHAAGRKSSRNCLVHAVLYLEQLLTTGGGWQDQVGGLMGGFQYAHSESKLPLEVKASSINVTPETISSFNKLLCLVYTGKTRLARNMLQDVIRNWYARNPHIVQTEDSLVDAAGKCKTALEEGKMDEVGKILDQYWNLKTTMAPGSEPDVVTEFRTLIKPYIHGSTLAGAGGGGFLFVLMKDESCRAHIQEILRKKEFVEMELYDAQLDERGLEVSIEK